MEGDARSETARVGGMTVAVQLRYSFFSHSVYPKTRINTHLYLYRFRSIDSEASKSYPWLFP